MAYGSSRDEFELSGVVVAQGARAVLFFDDATVQEIWISRVKVSSPVRQLRIRAKNR